MEARKTTFWLRFAETSSSKSLVECRDALLKKSRRRCAHPSESCERIKIPAFPGRIQKPRWLRTILFERMLPSSQEIEGFVKTWCFFSNSPNTTLDMDVILCINHTKYNVFFGGFFPNHFEERNSDASFFVIRCITPQLSKRDFRAMSNAALSSNHAHLSRSRTLVMVSRRQGFGSIRSKIQALATYDAFPVFSAKVRRLLYNPLGVLILAAAAALLCGLYLHTQGFALFGGLLLVIILGITWPRLSLLGLRGSISFDRPRSCEGERTDVCAIISNRLPWAAYGLAIAAGLGETGTEIDEDTTTGVGIASSPGWRTVRCRWAFSPPRRGMYPLQPPSLTTGFPFGLWRSKQRLSVAGPLLVWPRTYAVLPAPQLSADRLIEGSFSLHKVGMSGDVLGVRPYRRGDSLRRIHWTQTARHDRLIVCEFQANARPKIQLVLDADPRAHLGSGSDGSREWAIRVIASLAKGWLEAGVEVGAAWHDVVLHPGSGLPQLNLLLDSLAKLPDATETFLDDLLSRPRCRDFDNGLQIIVTTDKTLLGGRASTWRNERRRWVVLQAHSFCQSPVPESHAARLPIQPWIWIDDPDRIPALLGGESKEAHHDS